MTTFIVQVLPNISWDILVPKKKFVIVYLQFKFNWAS